MPFHTGDEILLRRSRVSDLHMKGWSQTRIAVELGVTQSQISQDIKALREQWQERINVNIDEERAETLEKVDHLASVYWQAWDKSTANRTQKRKKLKGEVNADKAMDKQQVKEFDTTDTVIERDGNPQFLHGVMRCIEKKVAILGLDAPKKVEANLNVEQITGMIIK